MAKGKRRAQGDNPEAETELTPEEKSEQAAAQMIGTIAENILEKAPRGLLEEGYFQADPDDLERMPSGPVEDGVYSDRQLVVRFEDGKPVEIWRADNPARPDSAIAVGNA